MELSVRHADLSVFLGAFARSYEERYTHAFDAQETDYRRKLDELLLQSDADKRLIDDLNRRLEQVQAENLPLRAELGVSQSAEKVLTDMLNNMTSERDKYHEFYENTLAQYDRIQKELKATIEINHDLQKKMRRKR